MSAMRKHNVTTFPRPPVVERTNRHIQIKWHGQVLADCPPGEAYWVLETHHAPGPSPRSSFPHLHPPSLALADRESPSSRPPAETMANFARIARC